MRNELQTRGNGYVPGHNLWDEFDRFFESFLTPSGSRGMSIPQNFTPPYDLEETEMAYLMTFDVPGVAKEDLKIEVSDNQLRVSGERRRENRETNGNGEGFRRYERAYGTFERVFTLPRSVDASAIEAQHDAGVLRLVLPKSETTRARTIQIGSGAGTGANTGASGENIFTKWFSKSKANGAKDVTQ